MRHSLFSTLVAPALAAGVLSFSLAANAADSKIAVVDMQRAVIETSQGAAAQAQLKKLFAARQAELDQKQKALQTKKEALEKAAKAGKVPQAQLQQQAEQFQKEYGEFQQATVEAQRSMQQKEGELTQPILQGILGVVRRIASQEGYEVVLEKSAAPYFRADLDVTDKAIQMFNQSGGAAGAPPGAKGPAAPPAAPPSKAPGAPPAPKKP